MFTGFVTNIGKVEKISNVEGGKIFKISAVFSSELKMGESVAINGACQSVIKIENKSFEVFSMKESLSKTNFNYLKQGSIVNLERSLKIGERLDGHLVQGHVDGVAKLISITKEGLTSCFEFEYDTSQIVKKGSICVNGISLTVSEVTPNSFSVCIIFQTLENTNLKALKIGDFVNIETDLIGKYVEKFLSAKDNKTTITEAFLKENGF